MKTDSGARDKGSKVSEHFKYLLNAMESASHAGTPFKAGYPDKREKVLAYVEQLELVAHAASKLEWPEGEEEFDVVSVLANSVVRENGTAEDL
jgi:hypothetical protein